MKKYNGFTLAELLITLGIIGVIAALILPAINKLMPDENKIMYLKVYDTLADTVNSFISNPQIYSACNDENNIDCSSYPLLNTQKPTITQFNTGSKYQGNVKFCNLLAYALSVNSANVSCNKDTYQYRQNSFNPSFITSDGTQWKIVQQQLSMSGGTANFQLDVYVDINGNNGDNCMYSADSNCSKPDRYKFLIAATGEIVPADPMGQKYIATRKSLTKKQSTNLNSTVLTSLETYKSKLGTFSYQPCTSDN